MGEKGGEWLARQGEPVAAAFAEEFERSGEVGKSLKKARKIVKEMEGNVNVNLKKASEDANEEEIKLAVTEGMKRLLGEFVENELVPLAAERLGTFASEKELGSVWGAAWKQMEEKVKETLRNGCEKTLDFFIQNALDPGAVARKIRDKVQEGKDCAKEEMDRARTKAKGGPVAARDVVRAVGGEVEALMVAEPSF